MVIEARAVRTVSSLAPEGRLDGFELVAEGGLHALVGSPGDGVSLALAALAGRTRLRHGTVFVDGAAPDADPRAIVWLGRAAATMLPETMRVDAILALAARVRGGRTQGSTAALASLGIEALGSRRLRTLSRADVRAVALAVALAADAKVYLLDEPLLDLEPDVAARAVHLLRQRARDAACVVIVGTASEREARRLGAEVHLLRGGRIVSPPDRNGLAVYRAVASDARALVGSLAEEDAIVELESLGSAVRVAGTDATQVAAAIGRAAVRADVDLVSLERVENAAPGQVV